MAKIAYKGKADVRELTASDLKTLGVEDGKKITFRRREVAEVDDSVAKALLENDSLAREFEAVEEEQKASSESKQRETSRTTTQKKNS